MRKIVQVIRALDCSNKPRFSANKRDLDLDNLRISMSQFGEIVVERFKRLKRKVKRKGADASLNGLAQRNVILRTAIELCPARRVLIESDTGFVSLAIAKHHRIFTNMHQRRLRVVDAKR
jgi:electron transfer flavoprotein alpha/beta subunit